MQLYARLSPDVVRRWQEGAELLPPDPDRPGLVRMKGRGLGRPQDEATLYLDEKSRLVDEIEVKTTVSPEIRDIAFLRAEFEKLPAPGAPPRPAGPRPDLPEHGVPGAPRDARDDDDRLQLLALSAAGGRAARVTSTATPSFRRRAATAPPATTSATPHATRTAGAPAAAAAAPGGQVPERHPSPEREAVDADDAAPERVTDARLDERHEAREDDHQAGSGRDEEANERGGERERPKPTVRSP